MLNLSQLATGKTPYIKKGHYQLAIFTCGEMGFHNVMFFGYCAQQVLSAPSPGGTLDLVLPWRLPDLNHLAPWITYPTGRDHWKRVSL